MKRLVLGERSKLSALNLGAEVDISAPTGRVWLLRLRPGGAGDALEIRGGMHLVLTGLERAVVLVDGSYSGNLEISGVAELETPPQQSVSVLAEFYFKDEWRIWNVGQGYASLEAAAQAYTASAEWFKPSGPATPAGQRINLDKPGDKGHISLSSEKQTFHINLRWQQQAQKTGFFGVMRTQQGQVDLDLGCMFEAVDGTKGVIQALGGQFGHPEFLVLDKDDRSGASDDGENLYIVRPELFARILIFAFIYEGTGNFSHVGATLHMQDPLGNTVDLALNSPDSQRRFCAICLIENHSGNIEVTKEERYFMDHADCDEHYRFGFRWRAGSKE